VQFDDMWTFLSSSCSQGCACDEGQLPAPELYQSGDQITIPCV
jgi:hypothetical protein